MSKTTPKDKAIKEVEKAPFCAYVKHLPFKVVGVYSDPKSMSHANVNLALKRLKDKHGYKIQLIAAL